MIIRNVHTHKISRRIFIRGAAVALVSGLTTGMYAWQIEPHWVQIVERRLPVRNLPPSLVGSKLVQLSDLHIGRQVNDDYLMQVFETVKKAHPEFVVITGDFTSYDPHTLSHAKEIFAHLPMGSLATVGVLGNHDYGPGVRDYQHADHLAALATANGVRILRNERVDIEGLAIIGLDDLWADKFNPKLALKGITEDDASIVLSHNPDTADLTGWGSFRGWILAGHTHGGQCKAPFFTPPILPVTNRHYVAGEYTLSDGRQMYINRGLGHLMPVRFNARPEITIFQLTQA